MEFVVAIVNLLSNLICIVVGMWIGSLLFRLNMTRKSRDFYKAELERVEAELLAKEFSVTMDQDNKKGSR